MATQAGPSLRSAQQAFAQGRLADGLAECRRLIERNPHDADALHFAAILEMQSGHAVAALEYIERAVREKPLEATQHQTRGQILRASGRRDEALAAFARAVELSGDFPEARASLGHAHLERGAPALALPHLARAVELRPGVAEWQYNVALAQSQSGNAAAALATLERALALRPRFALALALRGRILLESRDVARAIEALAAAIEADPALAEAHVNLGIALLGEGRDADAETQLRAAISLRPDNAEAWNSLGNAVRRQGRLEQALEAFEHATRAKPDMPEAWVHRGNVLRELDRVAESIASIDRALGLQPDSMQAHFCRAIALLLDGDLERGWSEYRWRLGGPADDGRSARALQWAREGRDIELTAEQGLGDVLFFLRWAPVLARQGARLRLRADARLFPLLRAAGLFEGLVDENDATAASHERTLPLGDLPHVAGGTDPHPAPFPLGVTDEDLAAARAGLAKAGPAPYVGVAWRAGSQAKGGEEHLMKSIAPSELGHALAATPATFVCLQRNPEAAEVEAFSQATGRAMTDRSALNADLPALLPLLAALDDYVGVSSTNVHLLAGLGRGARVLVPVPPEWRYGRAGAATPWFPRFRIYREDRSRRWGDALAELARDAQSAWRRAP